MNKHKLSLLIAAVAALAVLAGGWFLAVEPQLAVASANDLQRQSIDSTNTQNRAELARLQAQFAKLDDMKASLATLQDSIPAKADTTDFIRDLNTSASGAGATITSITVGDAQAYAPPAAATIAGDAGSATATATATPSASASAAPVTTTPAAPAPHTDPSITASNFIVIPVTVAFDAGGDANALAFTKLVQEGRRLFLIDTLSATAKDSGIAGAQSWSLSGYIYVLKTSTAATSGGTSGSSSTSTTTSSSASGTSASRTATNG
jgi:hypothetical protein